jgi:transcriptional antiterminator NusG
MALEQELRWYVIRVISGQEKKIKGYIEADLARDKQLENVTQILIPMEKYVQLKNGKKVFIEEDDVDFD